MSAEIVHRWDVLQPSEEQIREQVRTLFEGPPVYCYFTGYPPLPGERSYTYRRRVMPFIWAEVFQPKKSLWQCIKGVFNG